MPLTSGPLVASGAGGRTPCAEGCARQEMGKWTLEWVTPFRCLYHQTWPALGQACVGGREGVSLAPPSEPSPDSPAPKASAATVQGGSERGQEADCGTGQSPVSAGSGGSPARPAEAFLDSQEWAGVFSAPPWPNARTGVKTSPKPRGRALPPRVQTVVHRGPLLPAHTCPAHTCASSRPPGPANGHLLSGPRLTCPF